MIHLILFLLDAPVAFPSCQGCSKRLPPAPWCSRSRPLPCRGCRGHRESSGDVTRSRGLVTLGFALLLWGRKSFLLPAAGAEMRFFFFFFFPFLCENANGIPLLLLQFVSSIMSISEKSPIIFDMKLLYSSLLSSTCKITRFEENTD